MKSQIEVFWVKQIFVRWDSVMCDHIPGGKNRTLLIVCVFGWSTEGLALGVY